VQARTDDCFTSTWPAGCNHINNILAVQSRPQIAKDFERDVRHVGCGFLRISLELVDGEILVVA